jgi:hypothetical protein
VETWRVEIWLVEICAKAKASASATSNAVVNVLFKCELRWKDRTGSILHVCPLKVSANFEKREADELTFPV